MGIKDYRKILFNLTWLNRVLLVLLIFGVFYLIWSWYSLQSDFAYLREEINRQEEETEGLIKNNFKARRMIWNFRQNSYLEKIARERLGLKKPDEEIFLLPQVKVKK